MAKFPTDNNGVIIQLAAVAAAGAPSAGGYLIFGIDTQSNNALGTAKIFSVDGNSGYLGTTYKGTNYPRSFLDSGSNGLYFPDSTIAQCSAPLAGFYCPSSTLNLSATLIGINSVSNDLSFSVAKADTFANTVHAADNLAGSYTDGFDWGLPFFFGRTVYTALETNSGGPYIAF